MWREFWQIYWKRLIGAATGLFLGLIYLVAGFWDMLFVAFLTFIGYLIGKNKEQAAPSDLSLQRLWQAMLDRFRPFR